MGKDKGAGIILYPEDIARIKRSVKPEYQFAVIWALAQYATDGVMPTESDLGEGGMVAFEFVFEKVADALQAYKSNIEKRKAAANARWNANESEQMQTDANACKSMRTDADALYTETVYRNSNINNKKETVVVEDISNCSLKQTTAQADDGIVLGIDGTDLREHIERNQIADGLILRYRLGRDDVTREALISDLAEYGETKMREVLDTAASANKYDKISVKFWRAILNNNRSRASPKDTGVNYGQIYRSRQYTQTEHDAAYVNLDDMDEHGYLPGETGYMT